MDQQVAQKEKSEREIAEKAKAEADAKKAKEEAEAKSKAEAAHELERVQNNEKLKEEIKIMSVNTNEPALAATKTLNATNATKVNAALPEKTHKKDATHAQTTSMEDQDIDEDSESEDEEEEK